MTIDFVHGFLQHTFVTIIVLSLLSFIILSCCIPGVIVVNNLYFIDRNIHIMYEHIKTLDYIIIKNVTCVWMRWKFSLCIGIEKYMKYLSLDLQKNSTAKEVLFTCSVDLWNAFDEMPRAICGAQLTDRKDRDIHSESNVWCTAHRQGDPQ